MKKRASESFSSRVYKVLIRVPEGRVTTYKEVAKAINTKAYRAVGSVIAKNPYAPEVPCHRVVRSDGSVGNYTCNGKKNPKKKIRILMSEGITIKNNKIKNFEKFLFRL